MAARRDGKETMNTTGRPSASASLLRERFTRLRAAGLKDLKFWFVGKSSEDTTNVDTLCEEVMSVLDAHDQQRFVDISEKLK